jgi:hypothetical protein
MNNYLNGFEKTALNALKKRQLAKQFGLIPDGDWKWGLRQMRKGKTKEQLGHAPEKLTNRVRGQGKKIEVGAMYNKGDNPNKTQIIRGDESGVDLMGVLKKLKPKIRHVAPSPKAPIVSLFKNPGKKQTSQLAVEKPYHRMSSIHSHPEGTAKSIRDEEAPLIGMIRDTDAAIKGIQDYPKSVIGRMSKQIKSRSPKAVSELESRIRLKYPDLGASGLSVGGPVGEFTGDKGVFKRRGLGTHNTIVSGERSSVHTNRPDKINNQPKHKGKGSIPGEAQYPFAKRRLRSLYFEAADKKTKK